MDADSRAFYYGITDAPAVRLDGRKPANALDEDFYAASSGWGASELAQRTLDEAGVNIQISNMNADQSHNLSFDIVVEGPTALVNSSSLLNLAIVEEQISFADDLGVASTESAFYVLHKLLPTAAGTRIKGNGYQDLGNGRARFTMNQVSWKAQIPWLVDDLKIIAFLQKENEDDVKLKDSYAEAREIYQAEIVDFGFSLDPSTVTSLNEILGAASLYPNPANNELTLELPETIDQHVKIRVIDQLGHQFIVDEMAVGSRRLELDITDLNSGLYVMMIGEGNDAVRIKFLVQHR